MKVEGQLHNHFNDEWKILQELSRGLLEVNNEVNDDCEEDDRNQSERYVHQSHGQGFNHRVVHGWISMAKDDCPLRK